VEVSEKISSSKKIEVIQVFKKALELAERITKCSREIDILEKAVSGGYVEPGASGSITRGKIEILPTGRNFYAVDPRALPTKASWIVGVESAKKLLNYYKSKMGKYPESIGFILWSIDAYKADGEQLAQILYLLGVEPIWSESGYIKELRVIPLEELNRPRIDVTVRISGIVRDTLPNYIYLIDEAIEKIVNLNEPPEMNYVKKHYLEYVEKLIKIGYGKSDAKRRAMFRIFAEAPGTYGAGINYAIEASAWRNDEDLTKTWLQWSGYAYSRRSFGENASEVLILNLEKIDVVSRNHSTDEHDIFGCCCYFAYHGGFYNAVKTVSGRKDVLIVQVDTRDLSNIDINEIKFEIERIVRAKLLNPTWIEEMKKHGYRGASEFSRKILHLYGWSATTKQVSDWVFNEIARTYILNNEMKRWFLENNIYALEEITRRLIEAAERGLWKPSKELLQKIKEIYSEVEGFLEESISEGEYQGGAITIITPDKDNHWKENIKHIEDSLRKIRQVSK